VSDDDNDADDEDEDKQELVLVATPKTITFACGDEPPTRPLGHEDVKTEAQGVDGKLLIIIRAISFFLAKSWNRISLHKTPRL
jgi:hypothetical protein